MMMAWQWLILLWVKVDAAGFFDRLGSFDWYRAVHQDWTDAIPIRRGERVLEMGCGTGHLACRLARAGAEVVAVDRSPDMVARARERAPTNCEVRMGDALGLTAVGASFDKVIAASLLNVVSDQQGLVDSLAAATAAGGRVSVLFPTAAFTTSAARMAERRGLRGLSAAAMVTWGQRAPKLEPQRVEQMFRAAQLKNVQSTLLLDGAVASVTGQKEAA